MQRHSSLSKLHKSCFDVLHHSHVIRMCGVEYPRLCYTRLELCVEHLGYVYQYTRVVRSVPGHIRATLHALWFRFSDSPAHLYMR